MFFNRLNKEIEEKMRNYIKYSGNLYIDHYLSHRDDLPVSLEFLATLDLDIRYKSALAYLTKYAEKIEQKDQYVEFSISLHTHKWHYSGKLWNGNVPRLAARELFDMPSAEEQKKCKDVLDPKFFAVTGFYNDSLRIVQNFDPLTGSWGSLDDLIEEARPPVNPHKKPSRES